MDINAPVPAIDLLTSLRDDWRAKRDAALQAEQAAHASYVRAAHMADALAVGIQYLEQP